MSFDIIIKLKPHSLKSAFAYCCLPSKGSKSKIMVRLDKNVCFLASKLIAAWTFLRKIKHVFVCLWVAVFFFSFFFFPPQLDALSMRQELHENTCWVNGYDSSWFQWSVIRHLINTQNSASYISAGCVTFVHFWNNPQGFYTIVRVQYEWWIWVYIYLWALYPWQQSPINALSLVYQN